MKRRNKILLLMSYIAIMISLGTVRASALTEAEVQAQVNAVGKEAVTGNLFVWFLCAVAFLKVSQKIDSFMSSLGINVGHTGGSMLSELMIAARGVATARGMSGGSRGSGGGSGGEDFLKGGLIGAAGRSMERGAAQNATGSGSGGLGGVAYNSSVQEGGGFANRVIGSIATGKISTDGTISGENAPQALMSYLGYTALGEGAADAPSFSGVEIGGGRITATEVSSEHPEGIAMGMYNTDQYMAPEGAYTTVTAADGSTWYKQYAADTVERTPYKAEDGSIAYNESIVQKLPKIPPRKDRI
jgi:hypothetical protein